MTTKMNVVAGLALMNLKNLAVAAALVFAVGVTDARAGLIQIDNGANGGALTLSNVDVFDIGNLYLNGLADTSYRVTFKLLGGESQFENTLVTFGGQTLTTGGVHAPGTTASYELLSDGSPILFDFKFRTAGKSDVVNGSNDVIDPFFFPWRYFVAGAISADEVWIALEDGGGFSPDWDKNDWFGTLSVSEVKPDVTNSVPDGGSTMALAGLALAGVGMLRRRLA